MLWKPPIMSTNVSGWSL